MKYSILARKGESPEVCDVIIMGNDEKEFCGALKIYHKTHEDFESKSLIEIGLEAKKTGSNYDVTIAMPHLLLMKKEMNIGDESIKVSLTSCPTDRFHKINGDLEKTLGLFKWPGVEYLDIRELGKILVRAGYLTAK